MNKNTSMVLIAAVAGIMVAGALALTLGTSNVYAQQTATGGNGGIGGAGGAGGVGGNGGTNNAEGGLFSGNSHFGQSANGGDANGGHGGNANGGDAAACHNRCGARA
jgi:hypothetical protein